MTITVSWDIEGDGWKETENRKPKVDSDVGFRNMIFFQTFRFLFVFMSLCCKVSRLSVEIVIGGKYQQEIRRGQIQTWSGTKKATTEQQRDKLNTMSLSFDFKREEGSVGSILGHWIFVNKLSLPFLAPVPVFHRSVIVRVGCDMISVICCLASREEEDVGVLCAGLMMVLGLSQYWSADWLRYGLSHSGSGWWCVGEEWSWWRLHPSGLSQHPYLHSHSAPTPPSLNTLLSKPLSIISTFTRKLKASWLEGRRFLKTFLFRLRMIRFDRHSWI